MLSTTDIFSRKEPVIMGILNVTPDSFYDGGRHKDLNDVLKHCETMIEEGADVIDIGAFSTRPGSVVITPKEELNRIIPALDIIRTNFPEVVISIDTYRQCVAEAVYNAGADIINDISGGIFDENMLKFIGTKHIPYILMHITGKINNMHKELISDNVCFKVKTFFEKQIDELLQYGEQQIILDPGIGFNKTMECNFELLNHIEDYRVGNYPILIGISHKSLIYKTLGIKPQEATNGTTVLNTIALLRGADILRVHKVKETIEIVKLLQQLK